MIKNINDIEKALKLEEGTLQKAYQSEEEVEVSIPELIVRTKDEHEQFIANIDLEKKERYDAGKEKGVKDVINASIDKYGIDLTDKAKTFDNFASALTEKLSKDLKIPVDKKNEELLADNEQLRANYSNLESEFNTFKTTIQQKEQKNSIDSKVISKLPTEGTVIRQDELKLIFENRFNPKLDESGKLLLHKDGEVLKNPTTLNPMTIDEVMPDFINPYLKKQEAGTGSGDSSTKKETSYDAFEKEMKDKGINPGSQEFQREINERTKAGTLKI